MNKSELHLISEEGSCLSSCENQPDIIKVDRINDSLNYIGDTLEEAGKKTLHFTQETIHVTRNAAMGTIDLATDVTQEMVSHVQALNLIIKKSENQDEKDTESDFEI